jgi:hypothetical protein
MVGVDKPSSKLGSRLVPERYSERSSTMVQQMASISRIGLHNGCCTVSSDLEMCATTAIDGLAKAGAEAAAAEPQVSIAKPCDGQPIVELLLTKERAYVVEKGQ